MNPEDRDRPNEPEKSPPMSDAAPQAEQQLYADLDALHRQLEEAAATVAAENNTRDGAIRAEKTPCGINHPLS